MKAIFAFLVAVTPSYAQDVPGYILAGQLADVIGSDKLCALTIDEAAVANWVRDNVSPEDMSFASTFGMMMRTTRYRVGKLEGAEKAAHCAAVSQTAAHFAFTK